VRPILEYGSVVWSPVFRFDNNRLETVQRFFTNKISEFTFLPYTAYLSKLYLHSLFYRSQIADFRISYSLFSGNQTVSLSPHLILLPPSISRSHNLRISDGIHKKWRKKLFECQLNHQRTWQKTA